MIGLPVESFVIERLQEGGWRVIRRRADLTDLPIADFVSYDDAQEWVNWKSSYPKINTHVVSDDVRARPGLLEVAIEPKSRPDRGALHGALIELADEDPEFGFSINHQSGHTVLTGMSETHIADKIDVLNGSYGIDANVGPPQVAFLERPTQRAEVNYTHKKFDGFKGEFAAVKLVIEPNEPGKGYRFESRIVGDAVPKKYIPGIERGIESVLPSGVVAGFPVIDVKVALVDGAYHDVDSSALSFEIASRTAFREALLKAKSVLLEPIVKLEVVTPDNSVSAIIADLDRRRGQMQGRDMRGNVVVIKAVAPLISMFGFGNTLREISQGRATFTMQFDHYAPVPLPDDDPPFRPAIGLRA